ncbi:MAG: pentapeptide repeat-containing protein [Arenicellales bacterium]
MIRTFCPLSIIMVFSLFSGLSFALEPNQAAKKARLLETLECEQCDLSHTDLSSLNLQGANLNEADLSGANLSGTNLRGANLQGARMLGVRLSDTLLGGANLKGADLSDIDIDEVFESIEIIGTQFEGARFLHGVVCGPAPNKGGWGCQHL